MNVYIMFVRATFIDIVVTIIYYHQHVNVCKSRT